MSQLGYDVIGPALQMPSSSLVKEITHRVLNECGRAIANLRLAAAGLQDRGIRLTLTIEDIELGAGRDVPSAGLLSFLRHPLDRRCAGNRSCRRDPAGVKPYRIDGVASVSMQAIRETDRQQIHSSFAFLSKN